MSLLGTHASGERADPVAGGGRAEKWWEDGPRRSTASDASDGQDCYLRLIKRKVMRTDLSAMTQRIHHKRKSFSATTSTARPADKRNAVKKQTNGGSRRKKKRPAKTEQRNEVNLYSLICDVGLIKFALGENVRLYDMFNSIVAPERGRMRESGAGDKLKCQTNIRIPLKRKFGTKQSSISPNFAAVVSALAIHPFHLIFIPSHSQRSRNCAIYSNYARASDERKQQNGAS